MTEVEFQYLVIRWFESNGRAFPWRRGGIEPAVGLLTELLLRKTTAEQVSKAYTEIIAYVKEFLSSGQNREELYRALKPLGLQHQRMVAIDEIAKYLRTNYSGKLPQDLGQLLEIPHIGPYIANATRCFYLGQPAPIVDANIARLLGRFFGVPGNTSNPVRTRAYWLIASALLPKQCVKEYNWGLLDLGALMCTPQQPDCVACPLNAGCSYAGHSSVWQGLSAMQRLELCKLQWDLAQVPLRLAELVGLGSVPKAKSILGLIAKYTRAPITSGAISELDMRRFSVQHYCGASLEGKIAWVYGD
ncbi:A/G-specific DNA-adenine glycosylase [Thermanaeromonas toyohensis ToBE]|uniref:A/G-specific DNA-adenine glycosylase n=1 Tax=Thermanaeromonas toyohensis ToBE TaxID=698762 RepID=A0A1W1VS89_9FIRM|nr:hypothetical protein [Thermanaeromonas toyohensis]SMB95961.1 A/G-specific DNA-adenine glycosylase [Thermanaeromonas toyohensis ToBE]